MSKYLHIICLDAPCPPDYGGVFDLYYKIPELHKLGRKIILHYFAYRPERNADELKQFCHEVYAYPRSSFLSSVFKNQPYIVSSRVNTQLIERLNKDDYPVLLEGIHCCGLLPFLHPERKLLLRLHNDEAVYYKHIYKWEKSLFKKIYLKNEASKLRIFQEQLPVSLKTLAVSKKDVDHFKSFYNFRSIDFLPCFLPWREWSASSIKENYCLYHGNLTVSENLEAVNYLLRSVFSKINHRLIIAGKGAEKIAIPGNSNIQVIENPDDKQLLALIKAAQIHVLPSFNATGVKIKLLNVLFNGRHCITNSSGVEGSGMENCVHICENAEHMIKSIMELMETEFDQNSIQTRKDALKLYDNSRNAECLNAQL